MAHRPPLRLAVIVGAVATAAFLLIAYTPVAGALSRRLTDQPPTQTADAIVVLGAGTAPDGLLSDPSLRRLIGGLLLYRRGLAPVLIVMGPTYYDGSPREADVRAALLREVGVPGAALVIEGRGLTTRDEAALVAERLRQTGGRRVLLVTGLHHMTRARRLFEREGVEVLPAPVVEVSPLVARPDARLELARLLVQEALARLYYRVSGFL